MMIRYSIDVLPDGMFIVWHDGLLVDICVSLREVFDVVDPGVAY